MLDTSIHPILGPRLGGPMGSGHDRAMFFSADSLSLGTPRLGGTQHREVSS